MNNKYRNIMSLILMIAITCITQICTLIKSSLVAAQFGATGAMDAYNFANSIVSFLFGFVASAISTIIIPSYVNKKNKKELDSFITLVYGGLIIIIVVVGILRYQIVGIFSNRDEMFVNIACNILLVLLFSNSLYVVTNITSAYYQCEERYNIPKILNMISQVFVIIVLIFVKNITIVQYALILSLGVTINFVMDLCIAIKLGWRFKPTFLFNSAETKRLLGLFVPMIFSTGIYQLSLMIDSTIASRLEEGMLTILSYSGQIVNMVNSILVGNLLIYLYPKIVKRIILKNNKEIFWEQTSFFHLIICLVIAGFFSIGREGISLLFEHGKFGPYETTSVYLGALIYIIGQQSNIVRDLMYRYFYAIGDTKTAASNSVLVSVVNISVSLLLVSLIGFYGIILGTVIASFVSLVRIFIKFNKNIGFGVPLSKILFSLVNNIIIAVFTVTIVYFTKKLFQIEGNLLRILLFGSETVVVFMLFSYLGKRKEISSVLASI